MDTTLQDYLDKFLKSRNLLFPNGMMLYSYQMNQKEFSELEDILIDLCQKCDIISLLKDKYFSRCFVLYASEWWKREYSGGVWSWEPIFSTISTEELNGSYASVRSKAIIDAFRYWKNDITFSSGKKFLGAIIVNGGLPSKFMGTTNKQSSIVRVLHAALKFATEHNASNTELFIYTKELLKKLPESIRKDEICELITDIIITIIKLKSDYNLDKVQNPILYLNQQYPNWKDQFPLLLEDAAIEKMLNGFVEEASKTRSIIIKDKAPSVDRVFDFAESNELKFLFTFPEKNVDGAYFSKFFNVQNVDKKTNDLPETFYINNLDDNNTTIAIATMQLGSRNKYKIRSLDNSLDILKSVVISLSSADNTIYSKHIAIAEKLDIEQPLIFTKSEDDIFILRGAENISLKESECYIAYKENLFDFKKFGEVERVVKIGNADLILLKCSSDILTDELKIKLNCPDSSHNKYYLDGDIIPHRTIPHISYRGVPKIVCCNKEGNWVEIARKYINYYYEGTKDIIYNIQNFSGNVDINLNYENINKTFTITVFPTNFTMSFQSIENDGEYIKFNNTGCIKIEPIIDDNLKVVERNTNEFCFQSQNFKPDKVPFKLFWHNDDASLIYVPYPCIGASFFDEQGKCIDLCNISVIHLAGKKIKICNNLSKYSKCILNFKLDNYEFLIKKPFISRCIFIKDSITEIRLIDFEQNIKNLLNYSDDEYDTVKVSVIMDGKEVNSIKISRYDTSFTINDNYIYLNDLYSNKILENINISAVNLMDQDALPIQLMQNKNDDTYIGSWNIKELDLKNNIYMIISDKKSDVFIRPYMLIGNDSLNNLSLFHKNVIKDYVNMIISDKKSDVFIRPYMLIGNDSLNNLSLFHKNVIKDYVKDKINNSQDSSVFVDEKIDQENDLEQFLINEMADYGMEIWGYIGDLKEIFKKHDIPLSSLKMWKILNLNEYLLSRLLLFCSSDRSFLQKIKNDLNTLAATIPFSIWEDSLVEYLSYLNNILPENIIKNFVFEQFKCLTETFSEIETTIYYLLFKMMDKFSNIIEFKEIAPHISKAAGNLSQKELSDDIFIKNRCDENGDAVEMCWIQILQSQNSLNEENWIFLPFKDVYEYLKNIYPKQLDKSSAFLFKLNRYSDFIGNVVNFPQVCAFYAFYSDKIDEKNVDLNNLIKFSIKDFINFNQNYFIEVYKIAISIIIKDNN